MCGRGEDLLTLTQGAEPPSTSSPSIFAPAYRTPSIPCWPLAQPRARKGFLKDRRGGSGYLAPNPWITPHLLPPKLKPHKDDPDDCFCRALLGLLWGQEASQGPGLGLPVPPALSGGVQQARGCPHSGSWGLAGPHWERQANRAAQVGSPAQAHPAGRQLPSAGGRVSRT